MINIHAHYKDKLNTLYIAGRGFPGSLSYVGRVTKVIGQSQTSTWYNAQVNFILECSTSVAEDIPMLVLAKVEKMDVWIKP
jgi:hypothetical protein